MAVGAPVTTHVYPKTATFDDLEVPHVLEQSLIWLGQPRLGITYTVYPIHSMSFRRRTNVITYLLRYVEPIWEGYDDDTVTWCDRWFTLLEALDPEFFNDDYAVRCLDHELPFPRVPVGLHLQEWLVGRPLWRALMDTNADHLTCRKTCPWPCGTELDGDGRQPCDLLRRSPPGTRMFAER